MQEQVQKPVVEQQSQPVATQKPVEKKKLKCGLCFLIAVILGIVVGAGLMFGYYFFFGS